MHRPRTTTMATTVPPPTPVQITFPGLEIKAIDLKIMDASIRKGLFVLKDIAGAYTMLIDYASGDDGIEATLHVKTEADAKIVRDAGFTAKLNERVQREFTTMPTTATTTTTTVTCAPCKAGHFIDEASSTTHYKSTCSWTMLRMSAMAQHPNSRCVFAIGSHHLRCWGSQPNHVSNPAAKEV